MTDAASDAARGRVVPVGEVTLWVDEQGDPDGVAVVLLAGADSPGFRWTPAIVEPLVEAGYRVIRFDHRDCGRSTRFGPADGYLLDDMARDVVGLLAGLGVERAHMVGRSMGGMIAQVLAVEHPDRVVSISLIGSTPGAGDERLPGPDVAFVEAMTERLFSGPPTEDPARVAWVVELHRLLAGTLHPFDDDAQSTLAALEVETGWVAETGHGIAVHSSPSRLDRLDEIQAPSLVVHGTADPVFPIEHGRALGVGIDGAILIEVDDLGHEVPDAFVADLMPVLLRHLAASTGWPEGREP